MGCVLWERACRRPSGPKLALPPATGWSAPPPPHLWMRSTQRLLSEDPLPHDHLLGIAGKAAGQT